MSGKFCKPRAATASNSVHHDLSKQSQTLINLFLSIAKSSISDIYIYMCVMCFGELGVLGGCDGWMIWDDVILFEN